MKIILAIFCGLMLLFVGGCALILLANSGQGGGFAASMPAILIMGGVAVLNLLILLTLFGSFGKHVWAFHVLGVIDLLVMAGLMLLWSSLGFVDSGLNVIGTILVGGLGLKALLTFMAAKKV